MEPANIGAGCSRAAEAASAEGCEPAGTPAGGVYVTEWQTAPALTVQRCTLKRALQKREREEYLRLKHLQSRRATRR